MNNCGDSLVKCTKQGGVEAGAYGSISLAQDTILAINTGSLINLAAEVLHSRICNAGSLTKIIRICSPTGDFAKSPILELLKRHHKVSAVAPTSLYREVLG
jgi:hypothetical protein